MMSEELKPCPFCGGESRDRITDDDGHYIQCMNCNTSSCVNYTGNDLHIKSWNTRHPSRNDTLDEAIEAIGMKIENAQKNVPEDEYKKGLLIGYYNISFTIEQLKDK